MSSLLHEYRLYFQHLQVTLPLLPQVLELLCSSGAFIAFPPPEIGVFCLGTSNFSILDNNEDLVRWKAGGTRRSENLGF